LSFKSKLIELQNKLKAKAFAKNESGMLDGVGLLKGAIVAVIALVVIVLLVQAIVPGAITSISNTSAITGYSTWSPGTQSIWESIPMIVGVVVLMLFVALLLGVIG